MPPSQRVEANRIQGCLVRVWFVAEMLEGKCFFHCDSDAVSLKALGGLLCDLYSGHSPEQILSMPTGLLKPLGILRHIAENRQRTILQIEEQIQRFAGHHQRPGE